MKILAKREFKAIRMKQGYSIVALAELIGATKQSVGQVERRVNGIGPKNAKAITIALNVDFDTIFELVE